MNTFRSRLLPVCSVAALLCTGCFYWDASRTVQGSSEEGTLETRIGQDCAVIFRRDALGVSRDAPISPHTTNFNGVEAAVYGRLVDVERDAIMLKRNTRPAEETYWIPRSAILMIRFEGETPPVNERSHSAHETHSSIEH